MKLLKDCAAEYRKRHDEIWPDLLTLLKGAGITDYSIYLDEETNILFGILKIPNKNALDTLPANDVMKKWWAHMADIMETNPDKSPLNIPLQHMFYMP